MMMGMLGFIPVLRQIKENIEKHNKDKGVVKNIPLNEELGFPDEFLGRRITYKFISKNEMGICVTDKAEGIENEIFFNNETDYFALKIIKDTITRDVINKNEKLFNGCKITIEKYYGLTSSYGYPKGRYIFRVKKKGFTDFEILVIGGCQWEQYEKLKEGIESGEIKFKPKKYSLNYC